MSESQDPLKDNGLEMPMEESNFLKKIADFSPNFLFVIDLNEQKVIYINQNVKKFIGSETDAGANEEPDLFKILLHPEDYKGRLQKIENWKNLTKNEDCEEEVRFKTREKGWQWYKIKYEVLQRSQDGTVSQLIGTAQNIHEQKIYEEQLREEHRRFKNAQAIGHIGSYERKLPGDFVVCSEEFFRIHGREPQTNAIPLQEFISHVHPEDREAYKVAIDHINNTGEPLDLVTRTIRPDGEIRYVHRRAALIRNEEGIPIRIYGTAQDISARKKAEEELEKRALQLKESRALLKSIFNSSPNSLVLYDILRNEEGKVYDFKISMQNAYNLEKLGISPNVIGKKLTEAFPHVIETKILKEFIKTAETGIPADFETRYKGQGLNHYFHYRATKLENQILGTSEDITGRKKSEEILQHMLDGSISGITILESLRDEQGKIIDFVFKGANKAAEKINALSSEKMVGSRLLTLFPGVKNTFFESFVKVVETGEPLRVQRHYSQEHFDNWFDVFAVKMGDGFIMTFNDITEQKKAEQEMVNLKEELAQRAEDKYRKIINNLDEGFCLIEIIYNENNECVDYRYLETNPVFEEQSGLENALGRTITEMAPTIESYWFRYYEKVAKTGASLRFEDYSEPLAKWFDIYAFRLDELEENQIGVIFKDITERKEAEERQTFLLNLNDALRPLQNPEEIQITAMEILGHHLEVNRAFYSEPQDEDTFLSNPGYRAGVEKAPDESKFSDYAPEVVERFLAGETLIIEDVLKEKVIKKDQEKFSDALQARAGIAVPLMKNGKLVAAISVHQSTPRQWTSAEVSLVEEVCKHTWNAVENARSENLLRESEQKFRDLVEASALATWETDEEGVVVTDSESWRSFTGQSFEEWKGYGWLNALHVDDREIVMKKWNEAVSTLQKFDTEFRLVGKNGESRWTNVKAIPIIDIDGKITKWAGMNLDIHDMKMTEEALRKAKEEAEAASRAKEDFVSTISHEIRTPLNAVIGLTNLLLEKNPREDQKENLHSLSFSAKNLLSLINDILDFSKLEAGKMELAENEFDLPSLLFSLKQAHQSQALAHGTHIKLILDEKIPDRIATDQLKLSQVLHNLVSNAVKFTPNGQVIISVKLDKQLDEKWYLKFSIQDTGIGIAADKIDHIFEKFAQAESSTVRHYGGTGLGLSISKLLLTLMGSEIKVKSKNGEGSQFYFSLPVKIASTKVSSEENIEIPEKLKNLDNVKLLIVEDVEINREIIIQFLHNWWELKPDQAINGKEAVEMAKAKKYDLILMDVRMPVMDGYEATRRIRQLRGYEDTPILALTADKNLEIQQARQATQFNDLLTKPFEPLDLRQRILHYLSVSQRESGVGAMSSDVSPQDSGKNTSGEPNEASFDITKFTKMAGDNMEVLEKWIASSIKALETYKKEFAAAATQEDEETLSGLIHQNTSSLFYVQANRLSQKIDKFREELESPSRQREKLLKKKNVVLEEFDEVLQGLKILKEDRF